MPTNVDYLLNESWNDFLNLLTEVKPAELVRAVEQPIRDRAAFRFPKLSKVDRKNSIWNYRVPGTEGRTYTVKIKIVNFNGAKQTGMSDIMLTCNCPFFRWQGPEHWATVEDYLFQKPAGTASFPRIRDPQGVKKICKHCVATLAKFQNVHL